MLEQLMNAAKSISTTNEYLDFCAQSDYLKKLAFDTLVANQEVKEGDKIEVFDETGKSKGIFIVRGWEISFKKIKPMVSKIKKDGTPYGNTVWVYFDSYKKIEL